MPARHSSRRRDAADLALARVRGVLADVPVVQETGWVPPALSLAEQPDAAGTDGSQDDQEGEAAAPTGRSGVGPGGAAARELVADVPPESGTERSWTRRHTTTAAPAPADGAPGSTGGTGGTGGRPAGPPLPTLLDELRRGRLDPTRRGALALALVAVVACAVTGGFLLRSRPREVVVPVVERPGTAVVAGAPGAPAGPPGTAAEAAARAPAAGAPPVEVVVAVAGKVRRPGLVRLPPGSRVDDALRAAGGLLPGVDPGVLNLARRLADGEQVLVGVDPPPDPPPGGPGAPGAGPAATGAMAGTADGTDLNTATVAQLDALPGIGPVLAERIVSWRHAHGPFRSVDQLREVPGIGEAKFATLRPAVRV